MHRYAMADGIYSETPPKCRNGCRSYYVLGEVDFWDFHRLGGVVDHRKVCSTMFGKVLDHESKDILNEGIEIGRLEAAKDMSFQLYNLGVDISVIAEVAKAAKTSATTSKTSTEVDEETVKQWTRFREERLAEPKNRIRNMVVGKYGDCYIIRRPFEAVEHTVPIKEISNYFGIDEKMVIEWVE